MRTFSILFLLGSQKTLERKRSKLVASVGLDRPQEVFETAADDSCAEVKHFFSFTCVSLLICFPYFGREVLI